jgi:branched-chain amino acid transport system substrate-binding protein
MSTGNSSNKSWRRRDLIKLLGATAIAGPAIFERTMARAATSKVIKIGHVSSPTGVLAPVAQADPFILDQIRTALAKGITNGGVSYKVQIINKDSLMWLRKCGQVLSVFVP